MIISRKGYTMTERQIVNRVKKLQALEDQIEEITKQANELKKELQGVMLEAEHLTAGTYVINWVKVISNRLDTTRIRKELPDIYSKYIKETHSRRFSISQQ